MRKQKKEIPNGTASPKKGPEEGPLFPQARCLDVSAGVAQWALIISAGIFATTLANSHNLDLPLRNLLKSQFHESQLHAISLFFAVTAAPWYFKIVVGVFSDRIPLFGTLRRHYVIFSSAVAGALWLLAGYTQHSYLGLILTITAMEAMLVVGSTVMGALMVEVGQRLDAAGRLVAARIVVEGMCVVLAGPLAGYLAEVPFEKAATVGAVIAFSMMPIALIWLREPATARYEISGVIDAYHELRDILSSRLLWTAAIFTFAANIPQSFPTPLTHFQQDGLGFSNPAIGNLRSAGGLGSMLMALIYRFVYKRLPLRTWMVLGLTCSSAGSLCYLFYHSLGAAIAVDTTNGLLTTLWVLAMMEMAIWAAPGSDAAAAFALLMGAANAGIKLGDLLFSEGVDWAVLDFSGVAVLSAAGTLLVVALIPLLPPPLFGPPKR